MQQHKPLLMLDNTLDKVRKKTLHPCTSCCGLGYTHHQRLFKDGSEIDYEQDCMVCHGKKEVFS